MVNSFHIYLGSILSGIKAVWSASVQLAWGLCSFLLLTFLLNNEEYGVRVATIDNFYYLIEFMQQYWIYFWFVLFLYEFITNLKDFLSKEIKVDTPKKVEKIEEVKL